MLTFKQWLLEASTIPQLDVKTRRAFPSTRKRQNDVGSVTVLPGVVYVPNTPKNELTIDSRTKSRSGNAHTQRIILYRVQFGQQNEPNIVPLPEQDVGVQPIKLTAETSRVACSCMDFRFRFAPHNHRDDSLAGDAPPAYQRVPGSNRPEANPSNLPGMCKHLFAVVAHLKRSKLVI